MGISRRKLGAVKSALHILLHLLTRLKRTPT